MKHELLTQIIPSGGSLGSWVDEKRSQLRDLMRIADTLSIDILNAHGGIGVSIPMPRLFEGCTSNEGQLPVVGVCTLVMTGQMLHSRMTRLVRGGYVAVCSLTILEFGWWLSGCIRFCFGNTQGNKLPNWLRCPVACFAL